jgi:anti-sigma regulatory factor (Ser/Thr protein kinase)
MASTAIEIDPRLIAFMLPSIPESVRMARFHVRAALDFHGLNEYADDAEMITSELVTNAIQHVCQDADETISVTLARVWCPESVAVVVADSSSEGPILRKPSGVSEHGKGLQIVDNLSAHWGWHLEPGGKAIFAILASGHHRSSTDIPAADCKRSRTVGERAAIERHLHPTAWLHEADGWCFLTRAEARPLA